MLTIKPSSFNVPTLRLNLRFEEITPEQRNNASLQAHEFVIPPILFSFYECDAQALEKNIQKAIKDLKIFAHKRPFGDAPMNFFLPDGTIIYTKSDWRETADLFALALIPHLDGDKTTQTALQNFDDLCNPEDVPFYHLPCAIC